MKLIIVESPTKAKTLGRFLKGEYRIEATLGHIRDLPKGELGVDTEHDFAPSYVTPRDKMKHVRELSEIAAKSSEVILATDPDREGEAIAWHVASVLQNKKVKKRKSQSSTINHQPITNNFKRISFHEITETAIQEALKHPLTVDLRLVNAQQTRRILDRLVGYKLSPLLWQKLSRRWLSAGRVQSVAVRLIVEREREIKKFDKVEFWTLEGIFDPVSAMLVSKDGKKYEEKLVFTLFDGQYTTTKTTIGDNAAMQAIITDLAPPYTVSAVDRKEVKRSPAPPLTTSTMQQEAARRMYFSAKKTMQVAQKLYEEGYITYHRTDSLNLSEKFIQETRAFISHVYGEQYLAVTPRKFQTKSKVAQEAHEAIRPTNPDLPALHSFSEGGTDLAAVTRSDLNRDHERLYEMIWKRAVASQAKEAVFDSTTIGIASANGYAFQTQGSVIKFDGYLKITGRDAQDTYIPDLSVGQTLSLTGTKPEQHYSNPPPRYTEATLIKTLEEKDIGRPSTYAPIISTIIERNYVIKEDKKLVPTELGGLVTDFLVEYFPEILSLPFTADMEAKLDEIASGTRDWVPVIREFYTPFLIKLEETYKSATKVKMAEEILEEKCPKCGNPLVIRVGKFGKFIACTTYPTCDYTRQLLEKIDMKCPRDGGDIVIKKSRRGKVFYGCSNYPNCTFAAWKKEDIK